MELNTVEMCDKKAAIRWILSHVKDNCFHHFRMALWTLLQLQGHKRVWGKREGPHRRVYTLSLSPFLFPFFLLSSNKKLFHVVAQLRLLAEPLRGGGEFVRLMKMPFWPTYNFVQCSFVPLQLLLGDIKSRQLWSSQKMTPSSCHPIGLPLHVDPQ